MSTEHGTGESPGLGQPAAGEVTDGLGPDSVSAPPLRQFPYLGVPYGGFYNPS
jgi:hypothetical protein